MHAHRCVVVPRVPDKHEAVVAETNPRCRRLSKALGMNDICDGVGLSAVTAGAVLARLRSAVLARLRVVLKHVCDLLSEAEESKVLLAFGGCCELGSLDRLQRTLRLPRDHRLDRS